MTDVTPTHLNLDAIADQASAYVREAIFTDMPNASDRLRLEARRIALIRAAALSFPPGSAERGALTRLLAVLGDSRNVTPAAVLNAAAGPDAAILAVYDLHH